MRGEGRRPRGERERSEAEESSFCHLRKILVIPPTMRAGFNEQVPDFSSFPRGIRVSTVVPRCASNADDSGRDFAKLQSVLLSTNHGSVSPRIPADFFFPGPRRAFARVETRRTRGRVARHTPPERGRERTKTARATLGARSIEREFAGARSRDPARRREAPRRLARCVARSGERKEHPSSSHLVGRARTSVTLVRARATPRPVAR